MTMQWIVEWWNLVFLVPFALALLLALYTVSGVTFGDGDADADADADADVDANADVDADGDVHADVDAGADAHAEVDADADAHADVDADADADADHHHDHHHAHAHPAAATAGGGRAGFSDGLAFIGVGRMPLSLVLMILLLAWGFIGFVANQFLRELMPREWMIPLVSLPLAAVGSVLATRVVTRSLTRWMPIDETYARRRNALLGEVGEAMFPIDERFGMAAVRDDRGNLFQVGCRVEPGRPPIPKGMKVLLVAHDAKLNYFYVTPDDGGVLAREPQARDGRAVTERGMLP